MAGAFGGGMLFNASSPSSHEGCVRKILETYITGAGHGAARILDVGGTKAGFKKRLPASSAVEVVIANPQPNIGASYRYVQDIPLPGPNFDLALMFGVMMYLNRPTLLDLMRAVRQRMRGTTFLVAEPDPRSFWGRLDRGAKVLIGAATQAVTLGQLNPFAFTAYSAAEAGEMLLQSGFSQHRLRPDLTPWGMGSYHLPAYYMVEATI